MVAMRVSIHLINGDIVTDTMEPGNVMDFLDEYKEHATDVLTFTRESGAAVHMARAHIVKIMVIPEEEPDDHK